MMDYDQLQPIDEGNSGAIADTRSQELVTPRPIMDEMYNGANEICLANLETIDFNHEQSSHLFCATITQDDYPGAPISPHQQPYNNYQTLQDQDDNLQQVAATTYARSQQQQLRDENERGKVGHGRYSSYSSKHFNGNRPQPEGRGYFAAHGKPMIGNIDGILNELIGDMMDLTGLIDNCREHQRELSFNLLDEQSRRDEPSNGFLDKERRGPGGDTNDKYNLELDDISRSGSGNGFDEGRLNLERNELISLMDEIFSRAIKVKAIVLGKNLRDWHHNQQIGFDRCDNDDGNEQLIGIERWMRLLIDLVWRLRNQIKKLRELFESSSSNNREQQQIPNPLNTLANSIDESLNELVLASFIVTKQPPQVIKTNNKFDVKVQLLSDINCLIQETKPTIEVALVSETNVANLIRDHNGITSTLKREVCCFSSHDDDNLNNHSIRCYTTTATSKDYEQPQSSMMMINKFKKGDIVGHEKHNLEYDETTRQVCCHFKRLKIKKIARSNDRSAMEEKYYLVFYSKITLHQNGTEINGGGNRGRNKLKTKKKRDTTFHLMAISLPVVVIVCANQEALAMATATWHYAFAKPTRDPPPYDVPNEIDWRELAEVLSRKFRSLHVDEPNNTLDAQANIGQQQQQQSKDHPGRGLESDELVYLLAILVPGSVDRDIGNGETIRITWNQFAKDKLANKSFTFWEWFYSIWKLTKVHLLEYWVANKIYGFISKSMANELLLGSFINQPAPIGTFLLRFSETREGSISIVWKRSDTRVDHLLPCGSRELISRSLADRIGDDEELKTLYPGWSKIEAFGPGQARDLQPTLTGDGYSRIELRQIRLNDSMELI